MAIALIGAGCDASTQRPTPTVGSPATTNPASSSEPSTPGGPTPSAPTGAAAKELIAAGFPPEIAAQFPSVTSEVVVNEPGHYWLRQELPEAGLVRDEEVRFTQVALALPDGAPSLVTSRGILIYPLILSAEPKPGGYLMQTGFYIPPGQLTDEEVADLAPQPAQPVALVSGARLAPVGGALAGTSPGIVVDGAVGVSDAASGAGDLGSTMIKNHAAESASNPKFWESIDAMDDYYINDTEGVGQTLREENFARRGIEWQENELRIARDSAAAARFNGLLAAGMSLWEAYRAISDWLTADDQLSALERCNANPTNPIKRDPKDVAATADRLSEVRNELRVNNTIRAVNVIANFFASKIPGPVGVAAQVLSSSNDSMLSEDQQHIMSGVSQGVVTCAATYIEVTVRYRYSVSFVNIPPVRGKTNDRGMANEIFDAKVVVPLINGAIPETREWGSYRDSEDGGYDCVTYRELTTGSAAASVSGQQDGFASPNPGQPPTPTFSLSLNVEGHGLSRLDASVGFDYNDPNTGQEFCKANPTVTSQDGTASITCLFTNVDLVAGGLYVDAGSVTTTSTNGTESLQCQAIVKPLFAKPERDPTAPAPPPAR
jgi:hypothetical protein